MIVGPSSIVHDGKLPVVSCCTRRSGIHFAQGAGAVAVQCRSPALCGRWGSVSRDCSLAFEIWPFRGISPQVTVLYCNKQLYKPLCDAIHIIFTQNSAGRRSGTHAVQRPAHQEDGIIARSERHNCSVSYSGPTLPSEVGYRRRSDVDSGEPVHALAPQNHRR